jgi:hypothetical protein
MANSSVLKNAPTLMGHAITQSVWQYHASDWELRDSSVSKDGVLSAEYVFPGGDSDVNTTLSFTVSDDSKGVRHISVRLSTVNVLLDGAGVELDRKPVSIVMAVNIPAGMLIDFSQLQYAMSSVFCATNGAFTATAANTDGLKALNRGLVNSYPWNPAA